MVSTVSRHDRVTGVLTRYMELCDVPAPEGVEGGLGELFTEDAVWEGSGPEYAAAFGRTEGRGAIVDMLSAYLPPHPHFRQNVHLLLPGTVELATKSARGRWLMQQLSRYESGDAELRVARLDVSFELEPKGPARIAVFRTELMFKTPLEGAA